MATRDLGASASMGIEHQPRPAIATALFKLAAFTLLVPGTVTVWLPLFLLFPMLRHQAIFVNCVGLGALLLILLGAVGYFWCTLDFAFKGKGTPAPIDPPKVLVVHGLYRFMRNPMYVSVLLILVGESLFFESAWLLGYAATIALGFHVFIVLYEEPTLGRRMGAEYARYCRQVPRWIPRVTRARDSDAI